MASVPIAAAALHAVGEGGGAAGRAGQQVWSEVEQEVEIWRTMLADRQPASERNTAAWWAVAGPMALRLSLAAGLYLLAATRWQAGPGRTGWIYCGLVVAGGIGWMAFVLATASALGPFDPLQALPFLLQPLILVLVHLVGLLRPRSNWLIAGLSLQAANLLGTAGLMAAGLMPGSCDGAHRHHQPAGGVGALGGTSYFALHQRIDKARFFLRSRAKNSHVLGTSTFCGYGLAYRY